MMNNISFSEKFSPQHDNGERTLCWRKGLPESDGKYLITSKYNEVVILTKNSNIFRNENGCGIDIEDIIAYTKLPTPYKLD